MKINSFIAAILILLSLRVSAQENEVRCSTFEWTDKQKKEVPGYAAAAAEREKILSEWLRSHPDYRTRGVITIPVVVHLLYHADSVRQQISDWQITSQIDAMNEDFRRENADTFKTPGPFQSVAADCEIQFCLAQRDPKGQATTGIIRKITPMSSFGNFDMMKSNATGGDDAWPYPDYFNIWVGALDLGTLGYSTVPSFGMDSLDGSIVSFRAFGRVNTASTKYNLGRTATHEVGHWLNLYHIWGDDGGLCMGSDSVGDTPNQAGDNLGCPAFPLTDNCTKTAPGIMFMNYMDYTRDSCMNLFTLGQKARMFAALNVFRSTILNTTACNKVSLHPVDAGIADISQPKMLMVTDSVTPVLRLKNFGSDTLKAVTIYYTPNYGGSRLTYNWTGSLASAATDNVQLPKLKINKGRQLFAAYTENPNGQSDADTTNDFKTRSYFSGKPINVGLENGAVAEGRSFTVYPNPATRAVTLKFSAGLVSKVQEVELVNLLGERIAVKWTRNASGSIELHLPSVAPAMYFIRVRMEREIMEERIMVVSEN